MHKTSCKAPHRLSLGLKHAYAVQSQFLYYMSYLVLATATLLDALNRLGTNLPTVPALPTLLG